VLNIGVFSIGLTKQFFFLKKQPKNFKNLKIFKKWQFPISPNMSMNCFVGISNA